MAGSLGDLIVRVGANVEAFDTNMAKVSKRLGDVVKDAETKFAGLEKLGANLSRIGASLTAGVTLPVVGLGLAVTKSAADFESGMRKVTSLLAEPGVSAQQLDKDFKALSDRTLAMSRAMGVDAVKSADALYQAISSGVPKENAVEFLSIASKAAIAGMTDTRVAVDGLTTVIQAFGLKASETQDVADAMFQAVNKGKLEFPELASSIGLAAGTAAALGISYKELLAAGATLTNTTGQKIPEAMTMLQSAMKALIEPTKEMSELIAKTGAESGATLIQARGLEGGLNAIRDAAGGSIEVLAAAFGRVEGLRGALGLTGQNAQRAAADLASMSQSAGAAGRAFEQIDKSTARQFERLMVELKGTAILLGTSLLPAANAVLQSFRPLAEVLGAAVMWFTKLPEPVRSGAVAIAAMAAAVGPMVFVVGQMSAAFGSMLRGLDLAVAAFRTAGPAVVAFATSAIPAAASALSTFAVTTLPAAIAALGRFSTALLVDAALALRTFALTSVPAAAAALWTFATVTVPAATTAMLTFAATAIPSAVTGLTTFAATTVPAAGLALRSFAVGGLASAAAGISALATKAVPFLVGALSTLTVAVGAAALAFVAWKAGGGIGQWLYDQIPAFKAFIDWLDKIPGVRAMFEKLSGAQAITTQTTADLARATENLAKFLASKGIVVERGTMSLEEYNAKLRESANKLGETATAAGTAKQFIAENAAAQKKANDELKKAQDVLAEITRLYKLGAASAADVAKAQEAVRAAAAKAHPELTQTGVTLAEYNRQLKDNKYHALPFNENLLEQRLRLRALKDELGLATAQEILWNVEVASGTGALHELSTALDHSKETIADVVPELSTLTGVMRQVSTTIDGVTPKLNEFDQALKRQGIKSSDDLRNTAEQAVRDYHTIANTAGATKGEVEAAWAAMMRAQIEYRKSLGQDVSKLEAELAKWDNAHKNHQKKVTYIWQQIGQILKDAGRDFSRSLSDIFISSFFGNKQNEALDKEAAALRASLAERTAEWEAYQASAVAELEKIRAKHAADLAEQENELRSNLAEKASDFATYVTEVTARLEELRQKHTEEAASEIAGLQSNLDEKTAAYSAYQEEVYGQIEELRRQHAVSLAEELDDLEDALRDKRQAFEDYVVDVNLKLGRIGEDTADAIGDETRKTKRAIEEKRKDYQRDEEDTLDRIARLLKAGKKETDQEVIDLRKALARKKADLDEYIREQEEDLADFTEEQRRREQRQTADLKVELDRRTRDHQEYIAENAERAKEITDKHAEQLQKQTDDLLASLAKRGQDLEEYRIEVASKIAAITTKHAEQLAKEEAELAASLAKRKAEFEAYSAKVADDLEKLRTTSAQKLADDEAAIAASLAKQGSEYGRYVADVEAKLKEIKDAHVTVWGQIADLIIGEDGVLSRMAKAFTSLALDVIGGTLLGKIGEVLKKIPGLGDAIDDVFKKVGLPSGGGSATTPPIIPGGSIPTAPTLPSGDKGGGGVGLGGIGGGGATAIGAAIGSIVPGLGTAVGAAIGGAIDLAVAIAGLFGQSRQENTLNAIEENTRYIKGFTYTSLAAELAYLPKLESIWTYLWSVQAGAFATLLENVERSNVWLQSIFQFAEGVYDRAGRLIEYATATFELIRDEIVTRLAGTNQTGESLTFSSDSLTTAIDNLSTIATDGFRSVVTAISEWAKKPITGAVQYVSTGNIGYDFAAQLSTMNSTLAGITLILSRVTGTLVAPPGGSAITLESPKLLDAAIAGFNAVVSATREAARLTVEAIREGTAQVVTAGGPSITIDFRGAQFGVEASPERIARLITDTLQKELR